MTSRAAMWLLLCLPSCTEPLYDKSGVDGKQKNDADAAGAVVDASAPPAANAEGAPTDASRPGEAAVDGGTAPDEPQSEAGAGDARAPSQDPPAGDAGSNANPPGLPALASRLLGRYVARSYGFWTDNSGAKMMVDELALADFEQVGDHVELSMRVCRQNTRTPGFSLDLVASAAFPELRRTVSFAEDGFRTDDRPIATGFEREGLAACEGKAGQSIARQPMQRWLDSTCRCPASSAEPPTLNDCRVTDPDGDGAPALGYKLAGLGWTSHLATVIRSHHVRGGAMGAADLFAEIKVDEVGYQLSCSNPSCVDGDRFGRPCTSNHNGTQFVSLAARGTSTAISCEMALAREAELFPAPIPSQPADCVRDVLTDDPMRP